MYTGKEMSQTKFRVLLSQAYSIQIRIIFRFWASAPIDVSQVLTPGLHANITSQKLQWRIFNCNRTPCQSVVQEGVFPAKFKTAQVTPLIKRHGLDDTDPANYRPISNLNTVSKIVVRLFLTRLTPHVVSSPSYNPLQSAYRRLYSTETALLKMTNDIYEAMDDGRTTLQALRWVASYLHDRSPFVKWVSGPSTTPGCKVGVPQGFALGRYSSDHWRM